MRTFILSIFLILSQLVPIFCQEDTQWYIRDGLGLADNTSTSPPYIYSPITTGSDVYINGISQPRIPNPLFPEKNYCNDLFIIYENGDYFLSNRNIPCNIGTSVFPNPNDHAYHLPHQSTLGDIAYLYYTNKYEDDDPPEHVQISSSAIPVIEMFSTSAINTSNGRLTNHDLVHSKDVTFIIDSSYFKNSVECRLCYSGPDSDTGYSFDFSSFDFAGNINHLTQNQASSPSTLLNNGEIVFKGKCINIQNKYSNQFLNFKFNLIDESLIGSTVTFQLNCGANGQLLEFEETIAGNFHDPNYVELQCVWEENNKQFARYRVECYNEGAAPVNHVRMGLTLPDAAICSSVQLIDWRVGNKKKCGNCGETKSTKLVNLCSTNSFEVDFNHDLSGKCKLAGTGTHPFKNGQPVTAHKAWFEFCVEIDTNENLATVPLQPSQPYTFFEDENYPIVDFISEDNLTSQKEPRKIVLRRDVLDAPCMPCDCCTSCWCKIKRWFQRLF